MSESVVATENRKQQKLGNDYLHQRTTKKADKRGAVRKEERRASEIGSEEIRLID
jgi:hypothetical protein